MEGKFAFPVGEKPKAEQLADAGISTTTAHRYEQLAAPKSNWPPRPRDHAYERLLRSYMFPPDGFYKAFIAKRATVDTQTA